MPQRSWTELFRYSRIPRHLLASAAIKPLTLLAKMDENYEALYYFSNSIVLPSIKGRQGNAAITAGHEFCLSELSHDLMGHRAPAFVRIKHNSASLISHRRIAPKRGFAVEDIVIGPTIHPQVPAGRFTLKLN